MKITLSIIIIAVAVALSYASVIRYTTRITTPPSELKLSDSPEWHYSPDGKLTKIRYKGQTEYVTGDASDSELARQWQQDTGPEVREFLGSFPNGQVVTIVRWPRVAASFLLIWILAGSLIATVIKTPKPKA